jgi:hypothetical protein
LFNNFNIIYLVNNKKQLNKNSFIKLLIKLIIKVKTFIFLIIRYSIYIFNKKDNKRVNLILYNIIIIKGFYINIVLKVLFFLRKAFKFISLI